jgi:hypothetical protein
MTLSSGPPCGVVPVTVPMDVVLVQGPGLVVWVGAVTVFTTGFEFTMLTLFDVRRGEPPADWALDLPQRDHGTWLSVCFSDGRYRAADLNANTPREQPAGPGLRIMGGERRLAEGWAKSRWWVCPVPPPGPVQVAIHLNGRAQPSGTGYLDGAALAEAAEHATVLWPEPSQESGAALGGPLLPS